MKTCKKCNKEKELVQFHDHPATADKKSPLCKECANEASRIRYATIKQDPVKYEAERKRYNAQKRERLRELKKLNGK